MEKKVYKYRIDTWLEGFNLLKHRGNRGSVNRVEGGARDSINTSKVPKGV